MGQDLVGEGWMCSPVRNGILLPPAAKLGQGNIFRSVCQEFCLGGGSAPGGGPGPGGFAPGGGGCLVWGVLGSGGMEPPPP